jgi:hypothetical protein
VGRTQDYRKPVIAVGSNRFAFAIVGTSALVAGCCLAMVVHRSVKVAVLWLYAAFFCALTFAHLARCAAAIFLRAATDIVRFGFVLPV